MEYYSRVRSGNATMSGRSANTTQLHTFTRISGTSLETIRNAEGPSDRRAQQNKIRFACFTALYNLFNKLYSAVNTPVDSVKQTRNRFMWT